MAKIDGSNSHASPTQFRWHRIWPWLALLGIVPLALWGWVPASLPGAECPLDQNAAWISVDWTSQPTSEQAVAELAADAARRHIRYLFPFVTYVKPDGSFSPSYDYATEFVAAFRRVDRETRLLAWVGVLQRNDRPLGPQGWVDLADVPTRQWIAAFAQQAIEAGFDGVHLDVEHVDDRDQRFLLLLDEVRAAIGSQALLSIAANDWVPEIVNVLPLIGGYKWSGTYFAEVGKRVDQIAVMSYDSMMPHPALYRLWLREQAKGINKSLLHSDAQLLLGLSVSRESTSTHHPAAENMYSGLSGICAGVSTLPPARRMVEGIAIYAAWEASAADWAAWDDWIGDTQ